MPDSLLPLGLQHTRLPYPSLSLEICSNSCPLSQWCHPTISSSVSAFSSWPQSVPASGSFPVTWLLTPGGQYWSFSLSISPSNEYSGLLPFMIDWFDLLAVLGTLKSLLQHDNSKASVFSVQLSLQTNCHIPTCIVKKIIAMTLQTCGSKVMSLLYNMLSRLAIAFFPRSNHLLILWLQSLSAVILEPKKIKSVTASTFPPSISHEIMEPDAWP